MLGFKRRKAEVLSHWYSLIPGFQTSAQEFYADIERELAAQKVPGLEMARVEFAEGGLLSDKRLYLRMLRERLVFDVCAAPFGTNYFFSCRVAEIPTAVKAWQIVLTGLLFAALWYLAAKYLGFFFGPFVLLAVLAFFCWIGRNAVSFGLANLDVALVRTPVLGPLYERFLRAETYYRQDTRLMYLDLVSRIVQQRVEAISAAKGVKVVRFNEYDPILAELYKPKVVRTGQTEEERLEAEADAPPEA